MDDVTAALATLGVAGTTSWDDIRRAYRDQLMSHHPDRGGADSSNERTERIVEAFRVLRAATEDGVRPLPIDQDLLDDTESAPMVLHAPPGDVFARMCRAAEHIGHLSYADRDERLLQVMIGDDEWAPAQLTAELSSRGAMTTAMFSLEPIGVGPAPPIAEVVERLAQALRQPALDR